MTARERPYKFMVRQHEGEGWFILSSFAYYHTAMRKWVSDYSKSYKFGRISLDGVTITDLRSDAIREH